MWKGQVVLSDSGFPVRVKGCTQDRSLALERKLCLWEDTCAGSRRTGSLCLLVTLDSHLTSLRLSCILCPMGRIRSKPLPFGVSSERLLNRNWSRFL